MPPDSQSPSYYAVITADILHNKALTDSEKILVAHISTLQKTNGICFAGNAYFSKVCGVSKETISRRISSLVKKKIITSNIIFDETKKKIIKREIKLYPSVAALKDKNTPLPIDATINTPIDATINTPIDENDYTPIDENVKDNITSINNIKSSAKKKPFAAPSIDEIAEYMKDRSEAEKFFYFYDSKGWIVGKTKMKRWKSAASGWLKRNNKTVSHNKGMDPANPANKEWIEKGYSWIEGYGWCL